jgi:uncharacterized protein YqeY
MLKEKINNDYLVAFKAKDTLAKNLLSVIKGEIQTTEKNTGTDHLSDESVLKILQKTAKGLKENISLVGDEKSKAELVLVESYLPKQMSYEEVEAKVLEIVGGGGNNIGAIMKEFASLPADKQMVSAVAKKILAQ